MRYLLLLLYICHLSNLMAEKSNPEIDSLKKALETSSGVEKARVFNNLAKCYIPYAPDKVIDYSFKAITVAKPLKEGKSMARAYNNLGVANAILSKYDLSRNYFDTALVYWQSIGDSLEMASIFDNIGNILIYQSDYAQALKLKLKAVRIKEQKGSKKVILSSYINLGILYDYAGLSSNAESYFEKALVLAKELNNDELLGSCYANLASLNIAKKNYEKALHFVNEDYALKTKLNDENGKSVCYSLFSSVYYGLKNYSKAEEYSRKSIIGYIKIGDEEALSNEYSNLGKQLIEMKKYEEGIVFLKKGLELSTKIGAKLRAYEANNGLSAAYENTGKFQEALAYYKSYSLLKDSVLNETSRNQLNELEQKYHSEKKDIEIKVLNKEKELKDNEISKQRLLRNVFIIGFLIVFLLILWVFREFKLKQKANKIISIQKHEMEVQKNLVEEKQKEILDSINYAQRIQYALLASHNLLENNLPEHFILFNPKDIVSGDFYWATPSPEGFIYVTADCTGHGVPGAFMSLLNISKLSQTINENKIYRPDLILNNVRKEIINALNPEGTTIESKDGMDVVVCKLDLKNMKLEYAGANNSFYIIRNSELLICKADKMSVGKGHDDSLLFTYNEITLQKGDVIYTFTDGYADQFGGPKGKKYKYKQLEEVLLLNAKESMEIQKQKLKIAFTEWKGDLEQVDDVCVIGVRV